MALTTAKSTRLQVQDTLASLEGLLEKRAASDPTRGAKELIRHLEQLHEALGAEASETARAGLLEHTAKSHPRLLALCLTCHEQGLELLRHAALVVTIAARAFESGPAPLAPLQEATSRLIEAVRRHQNLEAELLGEAGRDIGGQG